MRIHLLVLASMACSVLSVPDGAHAQLVNHRDLSYAVAKRIAEAAVGACATRGNSVAVAVVDRAGETIVALRGDDAPPHAMENARRKAYTALTFRTPTTALLKRYAANDTLAHLWVTLPNVSLGDGGLPIKAGADVIGGLGVSGSPGADEPCSQAGLDKAADVLR